MPLLKYKFKHPTVHICGSEIALLSLRCCNKILLPSKRKVGGGLPDGVEILTEMETPQRHSKHFILVWMEYTILNLVICVHTPFDRAGIGTAGARAPNTSVYITGLPRDVEQPKIGEWGSRRRRNWLYAGRWTRQPDTFSHP